MPATLLLRDGTASDGDPIAALHAASWASAYRGILRSDYLDGALFEERRAVWRARLGQADETRRLVVAQEHDEMVGFACAFLDHDPLWGTLIDNLHVAPSRKREGLGRQLLRALAARFPPPHDERPAYLWVLARNEAAIAAYERYGGRRVEESRKTEPDGQSHRVYRYAWGRASALAAL